MLISSSLKSLKFQNAKFKSWKILKLDKTICKNVCKLRKEEKGGRERKETWTGGQVP